LRTWVEVYIEGKMKVLIIGGGGREHTLVWKIQQSPRVSEVWAIPGNAGIAQTARCARMDIGDFEALARFVEKNSIDLTIVGPETPLVGGVVDYFTQRNLRIFGPTRDAARLEGSKVFAKNLMRKYNIPTAEYKVFEDYQSAINYLEEVGVPVVVKADGLAAGKGSIVTNTQAEARDAIGLMMREGVFGKAGERIIMEECLYGQEASIICFTDGDALLPMPPSQDHKPVFDGDKGPNTGGMGAYAPARLITEGLSAQIMAKILEPTISALSKEGIEYRGVLYVGLMVTAQGPKVLEYNVRFGDPENQVILPLLRTDLIEIIDAVIDRRLDSVRIEWEKKSCVCVVLASGGYPRHYEPGVPISGLDDLGEMADVFAFHAGTSLADGRILTSGGRVLGITAVGDGLVQARDRAYKAVARIRFNGMHYRRDIGKKGLQPQRTQK
jgi:phosphoribosylamine--glycine ligase